MKTESKSNGKLVGIIACFCLFAMISFVTNLAAPLGTIWKNSYSWAGMLGNLMNFLAYLFMGIPAGNMLVKFGNKKTALWAMVLGFVGMGLQLLSSYVGAGVSLFNVGGTTVMLNLVIYLLGAFVAGFCVCMLNTVVNPMLNDLGGGGKQGNRLLQFGSSVNSLAGTLTPLFVGVLIGQVSKDTSMSAVTPLLFIALAVFVIAFIIISRINIPEPNLHKGKKAVKYSHSPWNFRHTVLGVIGIFFYVGIEVGIPGVLIFYLSDSAVSGIHVNATAVAGAVAACYWLLMLVGRITGGFISARFSSKSQLIFVSSLAIILIFIAIILPSSVRSPMVAIDGSFHFYITEVPLSAVLLVLCGLCTSVMWGGIFNLAVEGLGKYTAKASGIFMMMVVGGGVMPFIQNAIAGNTDKLTAELNGTYVFSYNPENQLLEVSPCFMTDVATPTDEATSEYSLYGTWDGKEWKSLAMTQDADGIWRSEPINLSYEDPAEKKAREQATGQKEEDKSVDFGVIKLVDGKKQWYGADTVITDADSSANVEYNRTNYLGSYWLVIAMLAYLLFYGLVGSKNVNRNIPVDEEMDTPGDPRNL